MKTKQTKKPKNKLLITYKKFCYKYMKGMEKLGYSKADADSWFKEYSRMTLERLEELRPDKQKTAKEQASPDQLEVLEYLEGVLNED